MPALRYRCPVSGKLAEVWTEFAETEADRADGFLDTVHCQICGRVHLVDPRTCRVLGANEQRQNQPSPDGAKLDGLP
jgi:hypothetical protein